jgi:hypothetical protein
VSLSDDAPIIGTASDNAMSLDESALGVGGTNAGSQSLGWDADPALLQESGVRKTEDRRHPRRRRPDVIA